MLLRIYLCTLYYDINLVERDIVQVQMYISADHQTEIYSSFLPHPFVLSSILRVCAQLCPILCDPMVRSLPGSSIHGIFHVKLLGWVATLSSRDLPDPGIESTSPASPASAAGFFNTEPPGKSVS